MVTGPTPASRATSSMVKESWCSSITARTAARIRSWVEPPIAGPGSTPRARSWRARSSRLETRRYTVARDTPASVASSSMVNAGPRRSSKRTAASRMGSCII